MSRSLPFTAPWTLGFPPPTLMESEYGAARSAHSPLVLTTAEELSQITLLVLVFCLFLVCEGIICIPLSSLHALLQALGVKIPWLRPWGHCTNTQQLCVLGRSPDHSAGKQMSLELSNIVGTGDTARKPALVLRGCLHCAGWYRPGCAEHFRKNTEGSTGWQSGKNCHGTRFWSKPQCEAAGSYGQPEEFCRRQRCAAVGLTSQLLFFPAPCSLKQPGKSESALRGYLYVQGHVLTPNKN